MTTTPTATDVEISLRAFTTALGVLRAYGADVPERMAEARARLREARLVAREHAIPHALTHADAALDAADLRRGVTAAAKERAASKERAEIASALPAAAARRAVRSLNESRDEIADAVLGSPALAQAFEDVERLAPLVPASAVADPDAGRHGLDLVANVAMLRRASGVFVEAVGRLTAVGVLSDYGPTVAHLAYARPSGEADPNAVDRALRGVRPGALDVPVWTTPVGYSTPVAQPYNEPGVPAAVLLSTPGVTLDPATTAREFESRVRAHTSQGPSDHDLPFSIIDEADDTEG
jgi:hypothetical protein